MFSMVLDPWAPRTVYAAGDAGVHRSGDYGRSWQARNTGLINKPSGADTTTINSVALDRLRSDSAKFRWHPVHKDWSHGHARSGVHALTTLYGRDRDDCIALGHHAKYIDRVSHG